MSLSTIDPGSACTLFTFLDMDSTLNMPQLSRRFKDLSVVATASQLGIPRGKDESVAALANRLKPVVKKKLEEFISLFEDYTSLPITWYPPNDQPAGPVFSRDELAALIQRPAALAAIRRISRYNRDMICIERGLINTVSAANDEKMALVLSVTPRRFNLDDIVQWAYNCLRGSKTPFRENQFKIFKMLLQSDKTISLSFMIKILAKECLQFLSPIDLTPSSRFTPYTRPIIVETFNHIFKRAVQWCKPHQ